MYFYPFTHGLLGSVVWAVIFYVVYYFVLAKSNANRKAIAWAMALGVLSHWFADLIVHTPDLPLVNGEPKLGFGLWNSKELTYSVEAVVLITGLIYYLKNTTAVAKVGNYAATVFVVFMLLVNYLNLYVLPKNDDINALTISALLSYFIFAGIARWVDKKRV
jgi:cobalamin synthase